MALYLALNGSELFIYSYRQGVFDGVSLSIVSGAIKYELVTDFKHNNVVERTYKLEELTALQEEKIKVANHRIDDLEKAAV